MKKILIQVLKIALPFLLGAAILWWMYRGFPFKRVETIVLHEMRWDWMVLSLLFGIVPQVFRGLRWSLALNPLGERPRTSTCVNAIFLSYASSLLVPRIGELTRCGTLSRKDGVSFTKSLGTVVTERMIDSVLVLCVTGITLLVQMPVFLHFFRDTGTDVGDYFSRFTSAGYLVTLVCIVVLVVFLYVFVRSLSAKGKVHNLLYDLWAGIASLRRVKHLGLYLFYTIGIWVAYFLHFYFTFYCFGFTSQLGWVAGLVVFCVGSIAVIVPTPNGAGPWHFAVKTILVLYGVAESDAIIFALIVHTIQTALLIVLGIYALVALQMQKRIIKNEN